jgi:hypothetical protein
LFVSITVTISAPNKQVKINKRFPYKAPSLSWKMINPLGKALKNRIIKDNDSNSFE